MADLSAFKTAYRRRAARALREESPQLQNDLRVAAPSASGEMASKTRADPSGSDSVEVVVGVPYASFTRPPGTRPHVIEPIPPNNVLSFIWPQAGGRVWFARVEHPGYQPSSDWYGDVIDTWPDRIEQRLASIPLE